MKIIGINKSDNQASIAYLSIKSGNVIDAEVRLRERFSRVKADKDIFLQAIKDLKPPLDVHLAETSYINLPKDRERNYNQAFGFYELMKNRGLSHFLNEFNPKIKYINHHCAHAMSALFLSPFDKCLVVVMDSVGSSVTSFGSDHPEIKLIPKVRLKKDQYFVETESVYTWSKSKLQCVDKKWAHFSRNDRGLKFHKASVGNLYEAAANHIFGNPNESGKVMGLAPYGKPLYKISNRAQFINALNPKKKFNPTGKNSKKLWQQSPHNFYYKNLAASVQKHFENEVLRKIKKLHQDYPGFKNVILVGGCALNCVTNYKLLQKQYFKNIYVPPFPGDEGVALGAALALAHAEKKLRWKIKGEAQQISYWGPKRKGLTAGQVKKLIPNGYKIVSKNSLSEVAKRLAAGEVIAFYQGRSEVGPRALGNRSILAHPGKKGMRDYLNHKLKFREDFRPYGGTCLQDFVSEYFDVKPSFRSYFMSFTPQIRSAYKSHLSEICHVDGSSRIQTLIEKQNPHLYKLIQKFGDLTGIYCLLNTSLNIMGEPIVETPTEAIQFLTQTPADALWLDGILIVKPPHA